LAAGDLDATFGTGGRRDIELTHPLFGAQRVIPLPGTSDMLVVGQEIRRFHADGSLDTAFGGGDGVIPLPDELAGSIIVDAAVLPNGKVVAATSLASTESHELRLFNADGSTAASRLIGDWLIKDIVAQPDGKILVLRNQDVMRFTGALEPDASFGTNGETIPKLQDSGFARASDGSFYGVGQMIGQSQDPFILKFNASGQPDTSFDGDGKRAITANFGIIGANALRDLAVDGSSLLTSIEGKIGRLKLDGTLDSNFGDGGTKFISYGDAFASAADPKITLLSDGKMLVVQDAGVTRLTAGGDIDPTYGRVLADLSGRGVLTADGETGQVLFTANGVATTLALHKLAAGGSSLSPIRLEGGAVIVSGTDGVDQMGATRGTELTNDLTVFRRRDDVARVYDAGDVTLMSFDAMAGNDVITTASAGSIPATVSGGDGDDKILGGDGGDSLSGNAGRDTIYGGNGADRLAGNGARDKLIGEGGADRLYGGPSGDWLLGAGGNDLLMGEGGNDQLQGGSGNDSLHGNAGDDTLISNDSAIDTGGWVDELFGDGGRDSSIADPNDVLSSIEVRLPA
jgi:uncharacterized delta-60 repeat protein